MRTIATCYWNSKRKGFKNHKPVVQQLINEFLGRLDFEIAELVGDVKFLMI
jgi:hypothetical protein